MYNPYSISNKKKKHIRIIDKILKFDDKQRLKSTYHPDIEKSYEWILRKMRKALKDTS